MGDQVVVAVECYSGSAYAQRPQVVIWQGTRLQVAKVLDTRQTPTGKAFTLLLANEKQIDLCYDQTNDVWTSNGLT